MRMLFFTAAAVAAATFASFGHAVKLEFLDQFTDDQLFNLKEKMFPDMTDNAFLDMMEGI